MASWASRNSVHPRPCGEQSRSPSVMLASVGSSPPVRGTGPLAMRYTSLKRFIPARAGNSTSSSNSSPVDSVHPRPCGEQVTNAPTTPQPYGSSPPVRGTVWGNGLLLSRLRFIPARAGNRSLSRGMVNQLAVHPRPCGEQVTLRVRLASICGSSPPVRGTVLRNLAGFCCPRFIPARAGNSFNPSISAQ